MSLESDGVWKGGLWASTVWAANVWREGTFVEATLSGTAVPSITQDDIIAGGKTIVITLAGDTWVAAGTGPIGTTANTQAIIDGITAATSPTNGWNNEVRDKQVIVPNLVTYSEQADNADWLTLDTIEADVAVAPDGNSTADRIKVENAVSGEHRIAQLVVGAQSADTHTISAYVKDDGVGFASLSLADTGEQFFSATFNLSDGSTTQTDVGTTSGSISSSGFVDEGNGWLRLWATGSTASVDNSLWFYVATSDAGTFTGNVVGLNSYSGVDGEDILVSGMQCQKLSELSDYIATTSTSLSSVVRTSDTVATITLDAAPGYFVTESETITVTVPAQALTGAVELVATPTFGGVIVDIRHKDATTRHNDTTLRHKDNTLTFNETDLEHNS